MILEFSPEDEAFRREVLDFLDTEFTPALRTQATRQSGVFAQGELAKSWHRVLYERGWVAPSWPREYGGTGWSASQRYIFSREMGLAGTPVLPAMGLSMCGPVVMQYGTPDQKDYFLPRILSGEHYWCQGYSEPNSGSDLASIQTKAVRDGDDYVVNGTKLWTTHAHHANWIFLLVRTDTAAKPQRGISFLVAPLSTPGITITPIMSMSGEHEVNSVFLDNVRIPVTNRLGEENDGWTVAKYLLEFERGGGSAVGGLYAGLGRLLRVARATGKLDDHHFATEVAAAEVEIFAIDAMERVALAQSQAGASVGNAVASTKKLLASTVSQELARLTMSALGRTAWVDQDLFASGDHGAGSYGPDHAFTPTAVYLNGRASTIFGGTSEVQKNILAKVALGL